MAMAWCTYTSPPTLMCVAPASPGLYGASRATWNLLDSFPAQSALVQLIHNEIPLPLLHLHGLTGLAGQNILAVISFYPSLCTNISLFLYLPQKDSNREKKCFWGWKYCHHCDGEEGMRLTSRVRLEPRGVTGRVVWVVMATTAEWTDKKK